MSVLNGFTWPLHFPPNKSGYHGANASGTENRILRKKKLVMRRKQPMFKNPHLANILFAIN
jgi:hypothetical protein